MYQALAGHINNTLYDHIQWGSMGFIRKQEFCMVTVMMKGFRALLAGTAILVLYIAIVSKLPTSHCHCHDKDSSPQQQQSCPFGKLRAITSYLSPVAQVVVQTLEPTLFEQIFFPTVSIVSRLLFIATQARGPPR